MQELQELKIGYTYFDVKEIEEYIDEYFSKEIDEYGIIKFSFLEKDNIYISSDTFREYYKKYNDLKIFKNDSDFVKNFKNGNIHFLSEEAISDKLKEMYNPKIEDKFGKLEDYEIIAQFDDSKIVDCAIEYERDDEILTLEYYSQNEIQKAQKMFEDIHEITKDEHFKKVAENLKEVAMIFEKEIEKEENKKLDEEFNTIDENSPEDKASLKKQEFICENFDESMPQNDLDFYYEQLYKTNTGEYLLYGSGNARTKYSKSISENTWCGGEKIIKLSKEEAMEFAREFLKDTDKSFEEIFEENLELEIEDIEIEEEMEI